MDYRAKTTMLTRARSSEGNEATTAEALELRAVDDAGSAAVMANGSTKAMFTVALMTLSSAE